MYAFMHTRKPVTYVTSHPSSPGTSQQTRHADVAFKSPYNGNQHSVKTNPVSEYRDILKVKIKLKTKLCPAKRMEQILTCTQGWVQVRLIKIIINKAIA